MARILLVEDADDLREKMRLFLQADHHTVIEAGDGQAACHILSSSPDIDMIITDLNMPVMNGLEMLRELRKMEKYRETLVIFHTTDMSKENRREAETLNVSGWLVKPAGPKNLKLLIQKLIKP